MPSNKKPSPDKDDFTSRVSKLIAKGNDASKKEMDEELAKRFNDIFSTQLISAQKNPSYHIPDTAYGDDIDKEIEKMLQDSDDKDDAIDEYIYGIIGSSSTGDAKQDSIQAKMDGFQKLFIGESDEVGTDESDALIRRLQEENALEAKYEQYTKSRDNDLEDRYKALKKDAPTFNYESSSGGRPKGSIPEPLQKEDLHDEMDDWCCICNEDATVECVGCEDDDKYCTECFFHTHRSESADYEATKHKSRKYQK